MDYYDYQQTGANLSAPKHNKQNQPPMPGREELLARRTAGAQFVPVGEHQQTLDTVTGEA